MALMINSVISYAIADPIYGVLEIPGVHALDACKNLDPEVQDCEDVASSVRVGGGYRITSKWSTEFSYAQSSRVSAGKVLGTTVYWDVGGLQLSAVGIFPIESSVIGNKFSMLAKLGVARAELTLSGDFAASAISTKLIYGIGAQYSENNTYSVRFHIEDWGIVGNDSTGTSRIVLTSLGIIYMY